MLAPDAIAEQMLLMVSRWQREALERKVDNKENKNG